jgi:putative oxidoreductase
MSALSASRSEDLGKLILRFAVGGLLLFHGIFKLQHGVDWIMPLLANFGLPGFLAYGSYLGEVLAPILLLVGWQVRIAALAVAFDLFMAIVLALRGRAFSIREGGGGWAIELEVFFILGALALFFLGGGRYAAAARAGSKK